uniref:protein EVI2B n=1 Tax=Doryrhamphus excisus TaxID=161450 RepID=UPI0025AE8CFD|nr:protein EVI2B [Doryrhamphus excisus]
MMLHFISLVFTLLLKSSGAVTSRHLVSTTQVTTGKRSLPTITSNRFNELPDSTTQPIAVDQTEKESDKLRSTTPRTEVLISRNFLSDGDSAATATSLTGNSSAEIATDAITATVAPVLIGSTQNRYTGQTLRFSTTNVDYGYFSTDSTLKASASTVSLTTLENKPTNTILFRSSHAPRFTEGTTSIPTTKADNKIKPTEEKPEKPFHSEVAAGLIGLALAVMIVSFLVIYIKKRKLQKQHITMNDWAGPTPFVSGGADNGQVAPSSSGQICLTTFLPKKLSKKMAFEKEIREESDDIRSVSTFGRHHEPEQI